MAKPVDVPTIYVGLSNGAIAATRAAYRDPYAVAVLLLSGLPAAQQEEEVAELLRRGVVLRLVAGRREQYFGGLPAFEARAGMMYRADLSMAGAGISHMQRTMFLTRHSDMVCGRAQLNSRMTPGH